MLKAAGVNVSIKRDNSNGDAMVTKDALNKSSPLAQSGKVPEAKPELTEGPVFDPNALSEQDKTIMRAMGLDPDKH